MLEKNNFVQLCKKLFFKTGEIGYYLLANEVEKTKSFDDDETLSM